MSAHVIDLINYNLFPHYIYSKIKRSAQGGSNSGLRGQISSSAESTAFAAFLIMLW